MTLAPGTAAHTRIHTALDNLEQIHGIHVLWACESGSRAWNFASPDSDWDVRLIYVHPRDWYLSVHEGRDVVELPIDEGLDLNGWDLRKSLRLLDKANAALQEWLVSPIVYRATEPAGWLRALAAEDFQPLSACHHYAALARRGLGAIDAAGVVRLKRYCYALRAVLCCQWVVEHQTQPPLPIDALLADLLPEGDTRTAVDQLLVNKRAGGEGNISPRLPALDSYLHATLAHLEPRFPRNPPKLPRERLDGLFRAVLDWRG